MKLFALKCAGILLAMSFSLNAAADVMSKPADGVTRVVFETPGDLSIQVGAPEKVTVEAEQKVLAQLDIRVKGETVTLASKGSFKTDKGIKYTVTIKSLKSLNATGSGSTVINGFGGNDIDVVAAGSGDVSLKKVTPGKLSLSIPGSGNIDANGAGKSVIAKIDGSGNIDTTKFQAQVGDARIEGSGNIRIHADETLKASIGGAGNIEYKGKAKVTQSITGAGNVEKI